MNSKIILVWLEKPPQCSRDEARLFHLRRLWISLSALWRNGHIWILGKNCKYSVYFSVSPRVMQIFWGSPCLMNDWMLISDCQQVLVLLILWKKSIHWEDFMQVLMHVDHNLCWCLFFCLFILQLIVRQKKHFNSLHIPKALQKALPFKNKPKTQAKAGKIPKDRLRPAVIREPHERKVLSTNGLLHTAFRCENSASGAHLSFPLCSQF